MPVYEYEPIDRECVICRGRVEAIQSIADADFEYCPTCGLPVRRLVSRASFKVSKAVGADKAASRGFSTWKKVAEGQWEKQAGPGADMIVGTPEDIAAVKSEKQKKTKKLNLDPP